MLKLKLSAIAAGMLAASPLFAESTHTVQAEIVDIKPRTVQQERRVPFTECEIVQVPVYSTVREKGGAGSVITGMIIGGLAGKGATGDLLLAFDSNHKKGGISIAQVTGVNTKSERATKHFNGVKVKTESLEAD